MDRRLTELRTEVNFLRYFDQHKEEISRLYTDLEDESTSRSSMDRRLTELRTEVNYHGSCRVA